MYVFTRSSPNYIYFMQTLLIWPGDRTSKMWIKYIISPNYLPVNTRNIWNRFGILNIWNIEGGGGIGASSPTRVSFETIFVSKQLKLEPKLVSVLSETKRLIWLFLFYTETEGFNVSLNRNKQKTNRNHLIGSIFWYFFWKLGFFRFFSDYFLYVLKQFV